MPPVRQTSFAIVCILLISTTAPSIGSGEPVAATNSTVGNLTESPQHNYTTGEIQAGLSLDPDTRYQSNADFQNNTFEARATATDYTYAGPTKAYHSWNKREHTNFTLGGENKSRYPSDATLFDGRVIRDAHATRFRHSRSVIAYNGDEPSRYSGTEGTVRGVVDYRVTRPSDDERPQVGVDRYDTYKERSLRSHSIESVCLIKTLERSQITDRDDVCADDAWVIGADGTNPRPAIEYEDRATGVETNYTLVAEVEATIEVRVRQFRPGDDDYTQPWPVVDTYTVSDTVIATDRWETTPYSLDQLRYSRTEQSGDIYEQNRSGIYITAPDRPWAGAVINGTRISSDWRFYTHRDTGWDTVMSQTNTQGKSTSQYQTVPIQQAAAPSTQGVQIVNPAPDDRVTVTKVERKESRQIPADANRENLSVKLAGNQSKPLPRNYTRVTGIVIQADELAYDDVTVEGAITDSAYNTADGIKFNTDRTRSNLTAKVAEANRTHVAVNIWLQEEDGDPIALGNQNGGVIRLPTNRTVQTNRTGQARVIIENQTIGRIQYEPDPWYGKTEAYKPATATYKAYPVLTSWRALVAAGVKILLMLLPLILVWYYIYQYEKSSYLFP